jgi:RsiW-degrading membrane proteinase PrsW (M82 family)
MKALGKGSIASWVRIALLVAWVMLWVAAAFLVLGAIAYGGVLLLIANGMIDPNVLTGGEGQIRLGGGGAFNVSYDDPGGATWPVVVPSFLIGGVAIAGALMVVWRLRRLFDSFSSGEPVRRENAQHLRVIG